MTWGAALAGVALMLVAAAAAVRCSCRGIVGAMLGMSRGAGEVALTNRPLLDGESIGHGAGQTKWLANKLITSAVGWAAGP